MFVINIQSYSIKEKYTMYCFVEDRIIILIARALLFKYMTTFTCAVT